MIMDKYYDDWKELWWLEGMMIIKKYCDNGSIVLWVLKGIMIIEKYYDKKEEIKKMVIKSNIVNEVIRG